MTASPLRPGSGNARGAKMAAEAAERLLELLREEREAELAERR